MNAAADKEPEERQAFPDRTGITSGILQEDWSAAQKKRIWKTGNLLYKNPARGIQTSADMYFKIYCTILYYNQASLTKKLFLQNGQQCRKKKHSSGR